MDQPHSVEQIRLSSDVTIAQYREFERTENRQALATMILQRFTERYITPMRGDPNSKHGFSLMAISCLMIEALYSFHEGWENSEGKSQAAFEGFFKHNPEFDAFKSLAKSFYKGVRCGILHQAETTEGWRILRKGDLFDQTTQTINAKLFHDQLETCLKRYCTQLETEPWKSELWENCRTKLATIVKNCEFPS